MMSRYRTNAILLLGCAVLFSVHVAGADPAASTPASAASLPATASPSPTPSVTPSPAPPAATTPTPPVQAEEDTISYSSGYDEGCASANLRFARQSHVKPNRDAKLYDSDKAYHDGWDHGYRKCEDKVTPGGIAIPGNSVVM